MGSDNDTPIRRIAPCAGRSPVARPLVRLTGPRRRRRVWQLACVTVTAVICGVACDGRPTAPSPLSTPPPPPPAPTFPPPAPLAEVSGTVWIHDATGVRPHAGARVSGWSETARGSGPGGSAVADAEGRYLFRIPVGSRLRVFSDYSFYQPCAVTVDVTGDATRDVHAVSDTRQLGAHLPPPLLSEPQILSGVVFETTPGGRQPVSDVHVMYDGSGSGGDMVTASTVTDSEGRYVLCGLSSDRGAALFASKPGFPLVYKSVQTSGHATTVDIELR